MKTSQSGIWTFTVASWRTELLSELKKEKGCLRLRSGSVCAVGWEPNPAHTPALVSLEEAYNRCGWKVNIIPQVSFCPLIQHELFSTYWKNLERVCGITGSHYITLQYLDLLPQVKIHKQTGVGAFYLNTQFKNMDFANAGDG